MSTYAVEAVLRATGADSFARAFQNAAKSAERLKVVGGQMRSVGRAMTAGVTLPVVGMGTAIVKTGAQFDDQMSTVQAVTGATGSQMQILRDQAKDMGMTTRFSATEAAEGQEMLARAGFSTNEIVSALPPVLDLAAAGAVDLGDAADITSNILSGFGMEATETARVADILAQASADSNTDVQGLGEAFKYVGPVASSVGLSIEDTAASIGILGDAGIQGGQAGNMLKRGLLNLSSPSKEASELMKELGIEVFDAEGNMKSMPEVIGELEGGLEGMSNQQKLATLETIFGAEAVSGWAALVDAGSDTVGMFSEELANSEGAAASMREEMEDNLGGSLRSLKSALEGLAISFYETGDGPVRSFVDWLTELVRGFINLDDNVKQTIVIIAGIAAAIGPVLIAMGMLLESINTIGVAIQSLGTVFGGVSLSMFAWIAVIGLVVAAIFNLWQTNEEFRNNVSIIWENIKTLIVGVWEAIQPGAMAFITILGTLVQVMSVVIGAVVGVVASFTTWIVSFIETHSWVMQLISVISVIIGVIGGLVAIAMVVAKVFTVVVGVIKIAAAVFAFLTSPIGLVIVVIGTLIAVVIALGEKFEWLGNIIDSVSSFVSDAWNGFLNILGIGTEEASDQASESIDGLADSTEESTSRMSDSADTNTSQMNESVTSNFDSMSEYGMVSLTNLNQEGSMQFGNLNQTGTSLTGDMSTDVQSNISDMATGSTDSVSGMNTDITGMLGDLESSGSLDMNIMDSNVTGSMDDMSLESISTVSGMESDISGMLGDLESSGSTDMPSLSSNVTGDISDMTSSSLGDIGDLSTSGASDFSGLESDVTSSASGMKKEVDSSFKGMSSTVKREMNAIKKISSTSLKGISTSFSKSMSNVTKTIQTSMNRSRQIIERSFSSIRNTTKNGMNQIVNASRVGTNKMTQTTSKGMQKMSQMYQRSFTTIRSVTRSGFNNIVSSARSGMSQVNSAFSRGMSRNVNISRSMSSSIVSVFRNLNGQLRNAGRNAMIGLQNGMNSRRGSVMSIARGIANSVSSTMRRALKIKSPSRITMAIGEFVGQGLAKGLEVMKRTVERASDTLAGYAIPDVVDVGIGYQISRVNRQAQSKINQHVTSSVRIEKQPAYINVVLGGTEFSAFVDDITEVQDRKTRLTKRFT